MEQHRIQTKFGPIHVRVYRLRYGWWPVALGGRDRLPAYPVVEGHALPESVDAALRRLAEAIDAMTADQPARDAGAPADGPRRAEGRAPEAAALHVRATQSGDRLERP